MRPTRTTRTERIESNLDDLYEELDLVRDAIKRVLSGEVVNYQIGSRNIERRPMSLSELRSMRKEIMTEIENAEAALDGKKRRKQQGVIFRDW